MTLCEEKKRLKERLVSLVWYRKRGPAAAALAVVLALAVGSCALIGDAELTPVPEDVRWKTVANPSDPEHFLMEDEEVTLFETKGFTMAFQRDIYDQLLIFSGDVDNNGDWVTLLSVYEKLSLIHI